MSTSKYDPVEILLVEDNPDDQDWTKEKLGGSNTRVTVAEDGVEAIAVLRREGEHADARPSLVLLDLRLPKKNGLEVLEEIRGDPDPALKHMPVIVMTGADTQPADIQKLTHLKITEFLPKPIDEKEFLSAVRKILVQIRLQMAELPQVPEDVRSRIENLERVFDR